MKKIPVLLGILMLSAGATQAATKHWTNGGANDWGDTNRWSNSETPGTTAIDNAIFSGSDRSFVTTNITSAFGVDLTVRSATTATSLTIGADMDSLRKIDLATAGNDTANKIVHNAGTVTVSGNATFGGDAGSTGVYEQSGGALNAGAVIVKSGGAYNLSGGSATTASMTMQDGGSGTFTAGTVNATNFNVGVTGAGTISQSGTSLVISDAVAVGAGGTYNVNGGSVTAASMTMQNGGSGIFTAGTVNATALNVGVTGAGTITQSGSAAVASEGLSVGAGGTYNLNGGSLTATVAAPSINGTLAIDGGTFTLGQNDLNVNGGGLVELKSGLLEHAFTSGGDLVQWNSDIEISGGTMDMNGQVRMGGEFTVIGSDATITIDRLNQGGGDYVFEFNAFDASGGLELSTIAIAAAGYINLGNVSITVDGSNYQGGEAVITLFDASFGGPGLNGTSTVTSVTGFTGGLSGYITQDQTTDLVTLTVIPEPAVLGLVAIFGGGILFSRRLFKF